MDMTAVQHHRRSRLAVAAKQVGGKAALGRLLGYKDGAFVGQMLRGERPVTEDTVAKLESKPGFRGWFSSISTSLSEPEPLDEEINIDVRTIIQYGTDEDRRALADRLRIMTAKARGHLTPEQVNRNLAAADRIERAAGKGATH